MDIKLYATESVRVVADYEGDNFVDVQSSKDQAALMVDLHTFSKHYIEIRKKGHALRVFSFKKKSYKKDIDFGYWEDAEVVFSYNPKGKNAE